MRECSLIYYVGPRKVTLTGHGEPIVYLGRDLSHLIGKKVMLEIRIVEA